MSDRMSNGEIEDVISSIRKLVSKNDKPTQDQAKPDDKLVLSPSQLVEEKAKEATSEPKGPLKLGAAVTPPKDAKLENELAELEQKVFEKIGKWSKGNKPTLLEDTAEDDKDPNPGVTQGIFRRSADDVVDVDLAEVETPDPPRAEVLMFSKAPRKKPSETDGKPEAKADEKDAKDSPNKPKPTVTKTAEKPKAASTPAKKKTPQTTKTAASKAKATKPKPKTAAAKTPSEAPVSAKSTEQHATELGKLLGEDELRSLVSDVLREELNGPLGERITRNVRKLVRREIAQALSGFDLDKS